MKNISIGVWICVIVLLLMAWFCARQLWREYKSGISDQTLKSGILRRKLDKIKEERIDKFGDFDHSRIDGK